MTLPTYNCTIPDVDSARSKRIFSERERSDVDKRLDLLLRRLETSSQPTIRSNARQAAAVSRTMQNRVRESVNIAATASISPQTGRNFQYTLARNFGLTKRALGLADNFTEAGQVLEDLFRARRTGRGTMHQTLAQVEMVGRNLDAYNTIRPLQNKYNVGQRQWEELTTKAVEIGWHPYLQQGMRLGPEGVMVLQKEQQNFFKELRTLGFSDADIQLLGKEAGSVADIYMEALDIATKAGITVDQVESINYFPRIFSEEAVARFDWKQIDDANFRINDGTTTSIGNTFIKGRNTFNFIVEDEILLDYVLRHADPDIYNTLGVKGIRDLFDDNRKLGEALFNHLSEDQVNRIVDSGLLSKIPMNSVEVFEHLKQAYELPFEGISELMAVDWKQAANLYRRQLESLAGQSEIVNLAARASIDGGWGVTEAQRLADPQSFSNYRRLSEVIPESLRDRFNVKPQDIAGVYIHPVAADLFRAQFEVATNPNALAIFGKMWQDMNTVFSRTVLSTTGFVGRQLNNIGFQVWAAGGNVMEYATMVPRGFKIMVEGAVQGRPIHEYFSTRLNDVKVIGSDLTERGIWERMQQQGWLTEIMPWSGEDIARRPSTRNLKAHIRYMRNVFEQFPEMSFPRWAASVYQQISRTTGELTDEAFYSFQLFNAEFENLARFATVKSLMDGSVIGRVGRGLQGNVGKPLSYDEAILRMRDYFYFYDELGQADKFIGQAVVPFWSFMSRNTFAQFRHMLRNPSRFVAYNRLYAALNAPAESEGDNLPIGGVPDWARDSRPLYWVRENDKNEKEYFMLPLRSLDPISDGIGNVTNIGDAVLRMFGIWPDSQSPSMGVRGALGETPWDRTQTNQGIKSLIEKTLPQWKLLYSAFTGEDVRGIALNVDETGRIQSSFLGVETTPWVRYVLETSIPILSNINKSNPFGLFGRAPLIDSKSGEVLDAGELSVFGVERSRRDVVSDYRATWQRVAAAVGFNFRELDIAYQMGMNEEQIGRNLDNGASAILRAERDLKLIQDPQRLKTQIERIQYMKLLWTQVQLDHRRFTNWRRSRGYEPRAAIRILSRQGLSIRQLDTLSEQEEFEVIQQVYGPGLLQPAAP